MHPYSASRTSEVRSRVQGEFSWRRLLPGRDPNRSGNTGAYFHVVNQESEYGFHGRRAAQRGFNSP